MEDVAQNGSRQNARLSEIQIGSTGKMKWGDNVVDDYTADIEQWVEITRKEEKEKLGRRNQFHTAEDVSGVVEKREIRLAKAGRSYLEKKGVD